ncbi:Retinoblastoma-binding protein 5 [Geodia barretti]|uniref:Retinoblastoma-binding protein 5 n=1 Tax=Geodia barretti TaxID=519541 RepID=A0AA35X2P5_GEOBA|nr:Retinoblastoma-binding protein 5 [Geodia barretti]
MNLELLQTVDQSYPEHNDGILDSGSEALTCAFNRRGTLLAVGCNDGRIAIWDFMTRSIARMCNSHIHPITSLSWSRSGRKLLSSSTDWNVMLWDVATGDMDLRLRFPSPILHTQFHPRDKSVFLVCPMKNVPLVVRRTGEEYTHTPLPTDGESEINIVASFDRRGERIVTGSSKGKILIIDSCTLDVLKSFKVYSGASTATAIKSIEFARRGRCLYYI